MTAVRGELRRTTESHNAEVKAAVDELFHTLAEDQISQEKFMAELERLKVDGYAVGIVKRGKHVALAAATVKPGQLYKDPDAQRMSELSTWRPDREWRQRQAIEHAQDHLVWVRGPHAERLMRASLVDAYMRRMKEDQNG